MKSRGELSILKTRTEGGTTVTGIGMCVAGKPTRLWTILGKSGRGIKESKMLLGFARSAGGFDSSSWDGEDEEQVGVMMSKVQFGTS